MSVVAVSLEKEVGVVGVRVWPERGQSVCLSRRWGWRGAAVRLLRRQAARMVRVAVVVC